MKIGQSFIGITVDTSQVDAVKREIVNAMGPEAVSYTHLTLPTID
jgi:hypothetical protein